MRVLLVVLAVLKCGAGERMHCPALSDSSTQEEENIAWMCDQFNYRISLAEWKQKVENDCTVYDAEKYWKSVFKCPDFSEIQCLDDSTRYSRTDAFNCSIVFCGDGCYLGYTSKRLSDVHCETIEKTSNDIFPSIVRDCPNDTQSAETTQEPFTTYRPTTRDYTSAAYDETTPLYSSTPLTIGSGSCASFGKCCPGRDDGCNAHATGGSCFCDEHCVKVKDCCADYVSYCGMPSETYTAATGIPQANSTTFQPGNCNHTLVNDSGTSGEVTSPNHPNYYHDNACYTWTIVVPEGMVIQVAPNEKFNLEHHTSCGFDYLSFGQYGTFCGNLAFSVFTTSSNILHVKFKSDVSVRQEGFSFNWTAIEPSTAPTPHQECEWTPWLNNDHPSGVGDFEVLNHQIHLPGCPAPLLLNGRVVATHTDWKDTPNVVVASPSIGLYCRNDEQPTGLSCLDYEVRFCCPQITTIVPVTEHSSTYASAGSHQGNVTNDCKLNSSGNCFWLELFNEKGISFYEAKTLCEDHGATLAVIPDETTYYEIKRAAENMTAHARFWLGMTINPQTKEISPASSFHKYWWSTAPYSEQYLTNIVLVTNHDPHYPGIDDMVFEGLQNVGPNYGWADGAICWKGLQEPISTTIPTTEQSSTGTSTDDYQWLYQGNVTDDCKNSSKGGCFWVELKDLVAWQWTVNYTVAQDICKEHKSVLAVIPNENSYHEIVAAIENMANDTAVWLGMTIDPSTLNVTPSNSFHKYWWSTSPYAHATLTKITLRVNHGDSHPSNGIVFEGLYNEAPSGVTAGAVCWKPPLSSRGEIDIGVRLSGGNSSKSGRVEIFHDGQWGTICDDLWDVNDGTVICRMLGFKNASSAPISAFFGQGTGKIVLDDVACTGNETSIWDCHANSPLNHNCGHHEDASVICT